MKLEIEAVKKLRQEGRTMQYIADQFGCTRQNVHNFMSDNGILDGIKFYTGKDPLAEHVEKIKEMVSLRFTYKAMAEELECHIHRVNTFLKNNP